MTCFQVEDFITKAVSEALKSREAVPRVKTEYNKPDKEQSQSEQVDIKHILETLRESRKYCSRNILCCKREGTRLSVDPFVFDDLNIIGSLFNTYIIAGDENNLYMFDQHAGHGNLLRTS